MLDGLDGRNVVVVANKIIDFDKARVNHKIYGQQDRTTLNSGTPSKETATFICISPLLQ